MRCPSCDHDNHPDRRFCTECGAVLSVACPSCRAPTEPGEKFCGGCGTSLAAAPARAVDKAEARKIVTVIFADLIGSSSLHERLDAESTRRLMDRYYRALRGVVDAHGGTVVKLMGDGIMAAFGPS